MEESITRGNGTGAARNENLAAPSDRSFGKRIAPIADPTNLISAIDRFVYSSKSFLFYGQQKIARKLAAA